MKYLWASMLGMFLVAQFASPLLASDEAEFVVEPIHSDLPLYTFDWADIWPRSFASDDGFGCTSHVAFGDWKFSPNPADSSMAERWERFSNYGVFHCAAILRAADERADLDSARWDYGFFVRLGHIRLGSVMTELWAIQKGTVPGSEYILLAREAGNQIVERFTVLQQRCPAGSLREAKGLDIWRTRYCAINSRRDLLALARRMAMLPPVGVLEKVAAAN